MEETKKEHSPIPPNIAATGMTPAEWDKVRGYHGAAYLVASVADTFFSRGYEILQNYGLAVHGMKHAWDKYSNSFNGVHRELKQYLVQDSLLGFCGDYDKLEDIIFNFCFVPQEKWNWQQRYLFMQTQYTSLKKEFEAYKKLHHD